MSRRGLFSGAVALAGATTIVGSAAITTSAAAATPASSVLVVLSLRGAADGLSLVVPHADPVYYSARPRIAVPADQLLAKDAMFGLHPQLAPLLPLWNAGKLAAVHATGLPAPNRSHFAAMEEVEDADPGSDDAHRLAEPADRHRRRAARRSRASTSAAASSRPRSTARSR